MLGYLMVSDAVPKFNEFFLSYQYKQEMHLEEGDEELKFFEVLRDYQFAIGLVMVLMSFV